MFDRIIGTVVAWDIPPAWLDHLAPDGVMVVLLRMNGVTRTIAFRRDGDHLVSTSTEVAGFVAMQGEGARPERILQLPDRQGRHVSLRFDVGAPADPSLLGGVLATDRTELWSGVTIGHGVSRTYMCRRLMESCEPIGIPMIRDKVCRKPPRRRAPSRDWGLGATAVAGKIHASRMCKFIAVELPFRHRGR